MQFSESSLDEMSSKMIIFAFNQCFLYPKTITFTQSFQSIVVCRKPSIYSHRRTCLLLSLRDPHGFPESCQPWVHSLLVYLSLSKVQTPADPPFLHLSLSFFPAPQPLFLSNSHQRAHTQKKTQIDTHAPQFPSRLSTLCFPRPPTTLLSALPTPSLIPFPMPFPPSLPPSPPWLSRPEAAAGTCIAGCYVGAMTTVMNSTWRSRIQADVSLCGCSASNGAHVSREWNSQGGLV